MSTRHALHSDHAEQAFAQHFCACLNPMRDDAWHVVTLASVAAGACN